MHAGRHIRRSHFVLTQGWQVMTLIPNNRTAWHAMTTSCDYIYYICMSYIKRYTAQALPMSSWPVRCTEGPAQDEDSGIPESHYGLYWNDVPDPGSGNQLVNVFLGEAQLPLVNAFFRILWILWIWFLLVWEGSIWLSYQQNWSHIHSASSCYQCWCKWLLYEYIWLGYPNYT